MNFVALFWVCLVAGLRPAFAESSDAPEPTERLLFSPDQLANWKVSAFDQDGSAEFKDDQYIVEAGNPMSGITWAGEFPVSNYEVTFDAQRMEGSDFFCGLTFPVGVESCSLILGGWGGSLVGLSSLNGEDASENETTTYQAFENKRWYAIRLEVDDFKIRAFIDGKRCIHVNRDGFKFSVRWEVEKSRPFGIATFQTKAAFRNLRVRRLPPPELHKGTMYAELNVPYDDSKHPRQRLDLYLPSRRATTDPLPVIVALHGGGWHSGDKREVQSVLEPFVESGNFAGAAIGYRLSQDAQWPAQWLDCRAAIRWLKEHSEDYQLASDRIGVIGFSAGGHLAAMLGVAGRNKTLGESDAPPGEERPTSRVACVVNFFGPSDLSAMSERLADPGSPIARLLGGDAANRAEQARIASPLTYVSRLAAPLLLVHGDADELVPYAQSTAYLAALRSASASVHLVTVEGGGHGGFDGPGLQSIVARFFDRHLHDADVEVVDATLKPNAP